MIVKIKGTDPKIESWRWYEADHVQVSTQPFREWCDADGKLGLINGDGVNEELMLCGVDFDTVDVEMDREISLVAFHSKDGTYNNVFCDTVAYLLNDDGETIDKLI